jgi:hypothetical protein
VNTCGSLGQQNLELGANGRLITPDNVPCQEHAAVFTHNALGDRKPKPGAATVESGARERLEQS